MALCNCTLVKKACVYLFYYDMIIYIWNGTLKKACVFNYIMIWYLYTVIVGKWHTEKACVYIYQIILWCDYLYTLVYFIPKRYIKSKLNSECTLTIFSTYPIMVFRPHWRSTIWRTAIYIFRGILLICGTSVMSFCSLAATQSLALIVRNSTVMRVWFQNSRKCALYNISFSHMILHTV